MKDDFLKSVILPQNIRKWRSQSKVVDNNGLLTPLYHGIYREKPLFGEETHFGKAYAFEARLFDINSSMD